MFRRPAAQGGGQSRSKWTGVILGAWSVGSRLFGVPEEIVDATTGVLFGALGYFLKGKGGRP